MDINMNAKIVSANKNTVKIEFEIKLEDSFFNTEQNIQNCLNEAGKIATKFALESHDTNGSPIIINKEKLSSKGKVSKKYQTPYGEVSINRNVYQNNYGGKTYCPLDSDCRIVTGSTPKFAKMVASKYSEFGGKRVQADLLNNHSRYISHNYAQDVSNAVAKIVENKENQWNYAPLPKTQEVEFISIGLDGTCIYIVGDGYRETMVGTISCYDSNGDRLSTIYTASAPEYGKKEFYGKFEKEILRYKKLYPDSNMIGVADGAKDNWIFLEKFTNNFILDFYHVSEYISDCSTAIFRNINKRKEWLERTLHDLKHNDNASLDILKQLQEHSKKKLGAIKLQKINKAITYIQNHISMMNYAQYQKDKYPIGSGVTEAACKVIVKQRLSSSGMKWKKQGAQTVLCLRSLHYSEDRWNQFWDKINCHGV